LLGYQNDQYESEVARLYSVSHVTSDRRLKANRRQCLMHEIELVLSETQKMWFVELDNVKEYDIYDYFPIWRGVTENGIRTEVLAYPFLPFIPRQVDSDDSGYISHVDLGEDEEYYLLDGVCSIN
jgi:hypothetical protein